MLIDEVTISITAGKGGNGAATFKRNAQTSRGGPDGGNGGNGGDIFVQGVNDISALSQFQFKKKILAEDGVSGGKQNMYGRNGEDTILYVPLGTTITDTKTEESIEITDETIPVLLAKGGHGGRGNNEFKSATNQTPTFAEQGELGQEKTLHLVMHLIADIGFIGVPNAGKSSLLKVLTNAKPKIGDYPFTTLEPNLGVLEEDSKQKQDSEIKNIVIADIPGLIEGAHTGRGLGTKFLKHVEKTKILIHCIDSSDEHIEKTYEVVRGELDSFSQTLMQKKEIILLTKTDLIPKEMLEEKILQAKKLGKDVYTVSIYDEGSLDKLRALLRKLISQ